MLVNPFDIIKAVDFTDEEIDRYWNNINTDGGFMSLLKPWSLMPMIIKGSKGSGKTHIMRYFSYELQKIRYKNDLKSGLEQEKFIGIYIRCSGFNPNKFSGKGLSDDKWEVIFHSFWESWVGETVCRHLADLREENILSADDEHKVVGLILEKLPDDVVHNISTFTELCKLFKTFQKNIDYEIQNFLFRKDKSLHFTCLIPTPTLTFGIPNILQENVSFFKDKRIMYLIDELENFSEKEQQLIQLIIREKPTTCIVRVGTRPYGIRTMYILNSIEENRIGSEFEMVVLDEFLRGTNNYYDFIVGICNKRIENLNIHNRKDITEYIEDAPRTRVLDRILQRNPSQSRGYISKLRQNLKKSNCDDRSIDVIIRNLSFPSDIIVERANYMIFYRRWRDGKNKDLLAVAEQIGNEAQSFAAENNKDSEHFRIIDKYRADIIDTLAREGREAQPNWGLKRLVMLSCGTPRNIINVLKFAYAYEGYLLGKAPFVDGDKLSIDAQMEGVRKTVEWFYVENRILSPSSKRMTEAVIRIGDYLRDLRFSNIPPQCSINIFSLKKTVMSTEAQKVFNTLVDYSYIIKVAERRAKNSNDIQEVYQINTTIMPQWELGLGMRGLVEIEEALADAIFELDQQTAYDKIVRQKLKEYNAPFEVHLTTLFDFGEQS